MAATKLRAALLLAAASLAGGVLLARLLYATDAGRALLGLLPQGLWSALFGALGVQGAEATSSAEVALVLLACVALSALLLIGLRAALRRR